MSPEVAPALEVAAVQRSAGDVAGAQATLSLLRTQPTGKCRYCSHE
jgi:hypothetical protein